MSPIWLRRTNVRSIDITGVIPDPAVRNRIDGGAGSGKHEVALGRGQPHDGPRLDTGHQVAGQEAFGHRLDGDGHRAGRWPDPDAPAGLDVSEYDRQRQRPSTSSPIPMYWPGW